MDWNDETIGRLRNFWSEGHSTAEIGRRLGVSKNAVVGKAHRLELSPRPSPIRREAAGVAPPAEAVVVKRLVGPTLPALASEPAVYPAAAAVGLSPLRDRPPEPRAPAAAPVPMLRAVASRTSRTVPCCWPIGEPGTKTFRFCDADAVTGKPYCGAHAQVAYVKVRDRREEAA